MSHGNATEFANRAWDNHERQKRAKWPTTLAGLTDSELEALNDERVAWNTNLPVVPTRELVAVHKKLDRMMTSTGASTQRWFGLVGAANLGKSQILADYVYRFHCEHTDNRPFHEGRTHEPVPVVWLQTAHSFKALLLAFMRFYESDVPGRASGSADDLLERVGNLARKKETKIVVLDDLQVLGNTSNGTAANQVKYLSEVLAGATFLATINTGSKCAVLDRDKGGDQVRKRGTWHTMKASKLTKDEWLPVLAGFEKQMPWCSTQRLLLKPHATLLHDVTEGSTGVLATLLRDITTELIETNTTGEDTLTEELIRRVADEMVHDAALAA